MDPSGMKASSPRRTPPRSSPIAQHAQSRTTPPLQSKPDQHNPAPSRPITDARHVDSGPSGHAHLLNPDKDHPSSILASMLSQALHDADSWKEKYIAEKRRADYFERMYEAFKGAFEPGNSTNAPSSTANAPTSNAKDSPSAPPRLTSPNSVSKSIKQLADALHHTEYERDEERARRLCLTDLWSQLRDYLDVIESHSRQARRAFDRRVDGLNVPGAVGGENLIREERERFVEVRAPIPSLVDVLHQSGHPNIYDSNGRKRQRHPSPSPSHHPHSPVNSHGQPNAKRPRTHNLHSQGQGQQQIYLDPSPAPGYIFQEYHPPPPPPHANASLPPPHGNSASSSSHHLPPPASYHNSNPAGGRDHPPPPPPAPVGSGPGPSREVQGKGFTYTTFHSRSETQTQRGRPPAGAGSRKGRSRSRSSSSSKSLDEMLLDTTTSSAPHGIPNNTSITSLPPIQSLAPGHNHLPPINSSGRDRADSHSTRSSGRSPPVLVLDRNADRALEKGLVGAGGERVGDSPYSHGHLSSPANVHHPVASSSSAPNIGSSSPSNNSVNPVQPVPGAYPPTNAQGQRICRQCGMAGRYKEGKCVEKWGPGPWGPGTVCDRCRKKMKRVERRGTLEQAQMLAAKQAQVNATLASTSRSMPDLARSDTVVLTSSGPPNAHSRDTVVLHPSSSRSGSRQPPFQHPHHSSSVPPRSNHVSPAPTRSRHRSNASSSSVDAEGSDEAADESRGGGEKADVGGRHRDGDENGDGGKVEVEEDLLEAVDASERGPV